MCMQPPSLSGKTGFVYCQLYRCTVLTCGCPAAWAGLSADPDSHTAGVSPRPPGPGTGFVYWGLYRCTLTWLPGRSSGLTQADQPPGAGGHHTMSDTGPGALPGNRGKYSSKCNMGEEGNKVFLGQNIFFFGRKFTPSLSAVATEHVATLTTRHPVTPRALRGRLQLLKWEISSY